MPSSWRCLTRSFRPGRIRPAWDLSCAARTAGGCSGGWTMLPRAVALCFGPRCFRRGDFRVSGRWPMSYLWRGARLACVTSGRRIRERELKARPGCKLAGPTFFGRSPAALRQRACGDAAAWEKRQANEGRKTTAGLRSGVPKIGQVCDLERCFGSSPSCFASSLFSAP